MKKVLSLVLVLTLVLGSFSFAFADTAKPTDNDRVNKLIELGLVLGDAGGYRLNDTITRAEAAVLVTKALDLDQVAQASKYASNFKDVATNHWALGYVNVVAGRGIVNGYPDGTFRPDANISYAEIITMMVQVLGGLTEQEAKAPWPANMITKASSLGILKDVPVANFGEIAVRERVFEVVYNTITSQKAGNYQVVKAIVIENNRVQSLKDNEVVVEVIEEVQRANFVTESRSGYEKGQNRNVIIGKDLGDVEDLLGKVVDISFDKAGKAVKVEVDKSYDYLTGYVEAFDKSLTVNDKKYTVRIDERYTGNDDRVFRTYYNNEDYKYADFYQDPTTKTEKDSFYAEFARVTVKDGKVLYIDAFNFSDIAPVKEVRKDGKEVLILDDNRDGSTKRINLDADTFVIEVNAETKAIKRSDLASIEADQVIHYIADKDYAETVFVRTDAELTGKYEKARSSRIEGVTATELYVDGEYYVALTAKSGRKAVYTYDLEKFATLEGTQRQIDERLDSYKDKEVVLLLDMNDNVQYVAAEVKDSHFLGMIENILGTEVKIAKADGEKEVYVAKMASTLVAYPTTGTLKEARLKDFNIGDLVRVQLDEDGNIKTLVKLADKNINDPASIIDGDNWNYADYAGLGHREKTGDKATINALLAYSSNSGTVTVNNVKSYLTKDTVVFINNGKEVKGTTMADVDKNYVLEDANKYPVAKAYVIYNEESGGNENIAKVIVFTSLSAKSAGEEKITRKVVKHEYTGGTNYLILADEKGETKTHEVKSGSTVASLAAGDIVEFTVTKNDAQVITAANRLIKIDTDNIYRIESKNDRRVVLKDEKGTSRYFWISAKALQFGAVEEASYVLIKADSLAEGSLIDIVTEAPANKGVRGIFPGTGSGRDDVTGNYVVSAEHTIAPAAGYIALDGKAYEVVANSVFTGKDNLAVTGKIPAGVDVQVTFVEGTQKVYAVKVLNFNNAGLAAEVTKQARIVEVAEAKEALKVTVIGGTAPATQSKIDATAGGSPANITITYTLDGIAGTLPTADISRPAYADGDKAVRVVATLVHDADSTITATKEFTLTILKQANNDATLKSFYVGDHQIDLTAAAAASPGQTLKLTAAQIAAVKKIAVVKSDANATFALTIGGASVTDLTNVTIADGNEIVVTVTAANGTPKAYTVTIELLP